MSPVVPASRKVESPAPVAWNRAPLPQPAPTVPFDLIYDLRVNHGACSSDVAAFSARFLAEAESHAAALLDAYTAHLRVTAQEPERSRGEYAVDLLMLGLFLQLYADAARRTSAPAIFAARVLLGLRRRSKWLKPAADLLRAWLFHRASAASRPAAHPVPNLRRLPRLIAFLAATGEFDQESARLGAIYGFLRALPEPTAALALTTASALFDWFHRESAAALGSYTRGVNRFLRTDFAARPLREDRLFCGRPPVEYHLGMVAAGIMNHGLHADFALTRRRAVLLPTCMRGARAATCRAVTRGVDITCAACDPACAIHRITRRLARENVPVYIVPHAGSFSRWLQRWQQGHDVGVIAVACLANILAGGYEMRARRIPSQCVVLDFPGCQKHWRTKPIPTTVNESRLIQIATTPTPQTPSS
jgi:hypothetical protein